MKKIIIIDRKKSRFNVCAESPARSASFSCVKKRHFLYSFIYEGFYCIEKVFGGRPLQFELFEKGYFETLRSFIEHGNLKFDWKDTKNGRDDFETFLEKRIENKQDEKPAQEILKLLHNKGLDRESRILGGLRNLLP